MPNHREHDKTRILLASAAKCQIIENMGKAPKKNKGFLAAKEKRHEDFFQAMIRRSGLSTKDKTFRARAHLVRRAHVIEKVVAL